jgi:hypothetical protein
MLDRTQWARTQGEPTLYHYVTFGRGPNIHPLTAACGLRDRFWQRIGVRINDRHCPTCVEAARRDLNDERMHDE